MYARLGAWQNVIEAFSKSPAFGIGLNNLRDELEENRIRFEGVKSETHAHNAPLSILAEMGLLGLIVFSAIVISLLRTGLNLYRAGSNLRERWRGITVISIVAAYMVSALFVNSLYLTTVSHVYVYMCLGGIAGLQCRQRSVSALSASPTNSRRIRRNSPAVAYQRAIRT